VAVKILRPDLARDPAFQARFRREAQSAASLNHPNIVAVYDTGEDVLVGETGASVTVPYIVMEYVDGQTLRQLLQSGRRLLPERALEMTAGVLAALDYSHRHGIVHRDIKPANVMLTRGGEVKVMDFGIARAVADSSATMTQGAAVLGTAQYLSPEQARGEIVDARSDLYSTGCLLYELLVGRPPFTGDSPVSVAYQHVSEPPVPPSNLDPSIPASIDAVVLKALAKNRDDRYSSAAEMRADVERAIAGMPVTAAIAPVVGAAAVAADDSTALMSPVGNAGGSAPATLDDSPTRNPWVWVGLTIGILALIGGVTWLGFRMFGAPDVPQVKVPPLAGLTVDQARTQLSSAGLLLGQQIPQMSPDKPKDTVIAQDPLAGAMVAKGQAVTITVSTGKDQTTVPNVVGLPSSNDARNVLLQSNLALGTVTQVDSDQPEGYVLSSTPAAGQQVDKDSLVNITVSNGKATVPDVVGKSESEAKSQLQQAGGFDVTVDTVEDGTVSPGTVVDQKPSAGTKVKRGSTVRITVAKAPPPPPTSPTPTPTPSPTATTPAPSPSPTTT
jgi:serine/threonine-protein kinase